MKSQQSKMLVLVLISVVFFRYGGITQEISLSLEQVRSLALEHNKKLQKAEKALEAAKAAQAAAQTGGKPTLDGSAAGIYLSGPLNTLLPEFQASATLSATQVIYAGGKVQNAKKLAASSVEMQKAQKALTEDEVLLSVESAYWNIVNLKEKNVLARRYADLLGALHKNLKNSFDAGLIYKNDLLKVEVKINEAALNITKAEDGLTMAKLSLAQLTGLDDPLFDIQDKTVGQYSPVPVADSSMIANRPEIVMLNKAVEIQGLQTKLLQADQRPTVALSAYGIAAFGKHINFKNGNNTMPFGAGFLSVNVPIFDWGRRKQKVREQQFKTDAQRLELEETSELIGLEIKNAWFQLNQSAKRIGLSEKSLKQAEENLRLNQDRLDAGTVVGEDVLEAQVLWQQAYSDLIDARAAYKINEAKYRKAIGNY